MRITPFALTGLCLLVPSLARATNVTEFPDNGSEQMGRGGAWVARASDPLATIFNPAGLAGQLSRVTVQNNTIFEHTCFSRVKASSDTTNDPLASASGTYPRACNDISPTINPQLGATFRITDRLGLGLLIIGPSSSGEKDYPAFVNDGNGQPQAAPGRYLLVSQKGIIVFPTIGLGYEIIDNLRIGASFSWGIARLNLQSTTLSLNSDATTPATNDTLAKLQVHDYFVPAVTVGALWSATPNIDIAAWYKWTDAINASGDAGTYANYFGKQNAGGDSSGVRYGDTVYEDCGTGLQSYAQTKPCGSGDNAKVKFVLPMEAKLGFRYHKPRPVPVAESAPPPPPVLPEGGGEIGPAPGPDPAPGAASTSAPVNRAHLRDPLSTDVFDLEADLTWANNSAADTIQIRFPGDDSGKGKLPVAGVAGGEIPPNADQKRGFKDVFGIRVGGDYNILPDQLAIRAGAFFETSAASAQYQNIDFAPTSRFGLALGGTYRLRLGKGEQTRALEISLGYGHIFFADQSRTDPNASGLGGLAGTSCNKSDPVPGTQTCADGSQRYRTKWPVNLGTITNSVNVINAGLAYRF